MLKNRYLLIATLPDSRQAIKLKTKLHPIRLWLATKDERTYLIGMGLMEMEVEKALDSLNRSTTLVFVLIHNSALKPKQV